MLVYTNVLNMQLLSFEAVALKSGKSLKARYKLSIC